MSRWTIETESKDGTKVFESFPKLDLAMAWIEKYSETGIHYKIEKVD